MSNPFGQQLRDWRQQRRLSQLELALSANVSARHISFLETGRAKPSQSMVLQLSETLEIPRANRNDLLNAAGFIARYAARPLESDDMRLVRSAIEWTLERHNPYPGIALDRHWQLVDANACAKALLIPMGLQIGDSLLDALASDTPFSLALKNRQEVIGHLINRLRAESLYFGGDAILDAATKRLRSQLTNDHSETTGTFPAVISARYDIDGTSLAFFSTISQFGSTEDVALADMKLELMFPADEITRQLLQQRAAQPQS